MSNSLQSFYLLVIFLFFLSSCCTKKDCDDGNDVMRLTFEGYENIEIDTVRITKYTAGSEFKSPVDSFSVIYSGATTNYSKEVNINSIDVEKLDMKVSLGSEVFYLNDFKTEKKECNQCFLGSDHYKALKSYKVNGVGVSSNYVVIRR